jgi:hypothetical protein
MARYVVDNNNSNDYLPPFSGTSKQIVDLLTSKGPFFKLAPIRKQVSCSKVLLIPPRLRELQDVARHAHRVKTSSGAGAGAGASGFLAIKPCLEKKRQSLRSWIVEVVHWMLQGETKLLQASTTIHASWPKLGPRSTESFDWTREKSADIANKSENKDVYNELQSASLRLANMMSTAKLSKVAIKPLRSDPPPIQRNPRTLAN